MLHDKDLVFNLFFKYNCNTCMLRRVALVTTLGVANFSKLLHFINKLLIWACENVTPAQDFKLSF